MQRPNPKLVELNAAGHHVLLRTPAALEVLTSIPKKKYPYPMTTSQELGWDTEKPSANSFL